MGAGEKRVVLANLRRELRLETVREVHPVDSLAEGRLRGDEMRSVSVTENDEGRAWWERLLGEVMEKGQRRRMELERTRSVVSMGGGGIWA